MDNFVFMNPLTCRTCLNNEEVSNSLHDYVDFCENNIEIKEILWKFSRILIDWNDPLQLQRICNKCTDKLMKAYEFFLLVENSERRLNEYFVNAMKDKEKEEDQCNEFYIVNDLQDKEEEEDQGNDFPEAIESPSMDNHDTVEPEDDKMMELIALKEETTAKEDSIEASCESKVKDEVCTLPEKPLHEDQEQIIKEFADISKKKGKSKTKIPKSKKDKKANIKEPIESTDEKELPSKKPLQCDICARVFLKKETLARHQKCHLGSGSFQCSHCARSFTKKDNLLRHMISHKVSEDVPKKHKYRRGLCPHCGESFPEASLIIHIRRHTGETPYKCDICDKGYPRLQDLTLHKRLHTGEKPHVCLTCGKAFSRTNSLARHIRVHTGERPYKCNQCDKSFAQSNDLNLHIRRHTGEKPYKCGVCNKNFINGSILKNHRKTASHYEDEDKGPDRYEKIRVTNPHRAFWTTKGSEKNIQDKDIQDVNVTSMYEEV